MQLFLICKIQVRYQFKTLKKWRRINIHQDFKSFLHRIHSKIKNKINRKHSLSLIFNWIINSWLALGLASIKDDRKYCLVNEWLSTTFGSASWDTLSALIGYSNPQLTFGHTYKMVYTLLSVLYKVQGVILDQFPAMGEGSPVSVDIAHHSNTSFPGCKCVYVNIQLNFRSQCPEGVCLCSQFPDSVTCKVCH